MSLLVFGSKGPWVALAPGGRLGLENLRLMTGTLAASGDRVLLHDRRNCGASDVSVEADAAEHVVWVEDLHALLGQLGEMPAFVGGRSSGCRLAIVYALQHPDAVHGLLLCRITGGPYAAIWPASFPQASRTCCF